MGLAIKYKKEIRSTLLPLVLGKTLDYLQKTIQFHHLTQFSLGKTSPYSLSPQKQASNKISNTKRLSSSKVKWFWPAQGKITKRFSNKENGYKGLQITNRKGASVLAAAQGTVVYAGNALRGYGSLIILKHNDDYLSAYAHNSKLLVKEKQKVKAGQKIAEIGNSESPVTALRFEIRYRGQAVNPAKYLP